MTVDGGKSESPSTLLFWADARARRYRCEGIEDGKTDPIPSHSRNPHHRLFERRKLSRRSERVPFLEHGAVGREHAPERESDLSGGHVPRSVAVKDQSVEGRVTNCSRDSPERVGDDVVARNDAATVAEHGRNGLVCDIVVVPLQAWIESHAKFRLDPLGKSEKWGSPPRIMRAATCSGVIPSSGPSIVLVRAGLSFCSLSKKLGENMVAGRKRWTVMP